MKQEMVILENDYRDLDAYFARYQVKKIFLVCGASFDLLPESRYFGNLARMGIEVCRFSDFCPNPQYASVVRGVQRYRDFGGGLIFAVGGGSAMDVAKCIKLYVDMKPDRSYFEQPVLPNAIPLWVMPTTAGTGSEATRFAVLYDRGEKKSITHESCLPSKVFMDVRVLATLPVYQKKATMLDALCHGIESFWSIHSTKESRQYAKTAIRLVLENYELYLKNDFAGCSNMLMAANTAGRAINITKTTAGHAMCYKLTTLYGIAHGHAAALCVSKLWPYMLAHTADCMDSRGEVYLLEMFEELSQIWGVDKVGAGPESFGRLLAELGMDMPAGRADVGYDVLAASVNVERLSNNPVSLDSKAISLLYQQII